ncbi:MAG: ribosome biogenesis GTPase Der [Candidatus Babeliales bacterium]
MSNYAKVVLAGRKNVGKSTLFNRLSENVKSITLDYEGVTRDFLSDIVSWQDTAFQLIDSGGIELKKTSDQMDQKVQQIAQNLIASADIVLFVVDGTVGLVQQDAQIAKLLHKLGKQVILVINKIDTKIAREHEHEFAQFGFKDVCPLSAEHSIGIGELLESIADKLRGKTFKHKEEKPAYRVALLGKPNVGKSSLMNLLLEQERSIVADMPGTTREAITEPFSFYKDTIALTDTPGVRRKRRVDETLESLMVKSTFRAVENSDIVLLMIDGSEGTLSDQERKLAFHVLQEQKCLILLINKEDLMDEGHQATLENDFELHEYLLKKIPVLTISCKTGKNIGKIMPLVKKVWERYTQKFDERELNELLKEAFAHRPHYHKGEMLVFHSIKQVKAGPPTLVLKVNHAEWFGDSQLAFIENILRKYYDLLGVPLVLLARTKKRRPR